jgi:PAS domain S-box-containing protein
MSAFSKNITTDLLISRKTGMIIFEDNEIIDYIKIYNQSHKVGTWDYFVDSGEVFWSKETFEIHGLTPQPGPVAVSRAVRYYHPEDARALAELLASAVRLKSGFSFKLRLIRSDGVVRVTESNGAPVVDSAGKVKRLVGTFRDVTSQTEYENMRRSHGELLMKTVLSLPVAAALLDGESRYLAYSERWIVDFNLPQDVDYRGQSHLDVLPDLAKQQAKEIALALKGNAIGKDNQRYELASGVSYIVDWRMQPWRDKTGQVGGVLVLMHVKYTGSPRTKLTSEMVAGESPL